MKIYDLIEDLNEENMDNTAEKNVNPSAVKNTNDGYNSLYKDLYQAVMSEQSLDESIDFGLFANFAAVAPMAAKYVVANALNKARTEATQTKNMISVMRRSKNNQPVAPEEEKAMQKQFKDLFTYAIIGSAAAIASLMAGPEAAAAGTAAAVYKRELFDTIGKYGPKLIIGLLSNNGIDVVKELLDKFVSRNMNPTINERKSIFESIGAGDHYFETWQNKIHTILCEVALDPAQIEALFTSIETGAGRSALGKGVDAVKGAATAVKGAADKISDAWFNKFGGMLQSSDVVQGFDQKWETIKSSIAAKHPDIAARLAKYGTYAKNNPKMHKFLLAIAGSAAAALGVAAAGGIGAGALAVGTGTGIAVGILNIADRLLQGQKASTAIGRGATTGAIAGLAAGAAAKIGNMVKSGINNDAVGQLNGMKITRHSMNWNGQPFSAVTQEPLTSQLNNAFDALGSNPSPEAVNSFANLMAKASSPGYQSQLSKAREAIEAIKAAASSSVAIVKQLTQLGAAAAGGAASAATNQQPPAPVTETLNRQQINELFGMTGNKIDAATLRKAWVDAGSPTDSEEIKKVFAGIKGFDPALMDKALTDMGVAPPPPPPDADADKTEPEPDTSEPEPPKLSASIFADYRKLRTAWEDFIDSGTAIPPGVRGVIKDILLTGFTTVEGKKNLILSSNILREQLTSREMYKVNKLLNEMAVSWEQLGYTYTRRNSMFIREAAADPAVIENLWKEVVRVLYDTGKTGSNPQNNPINTASNFLGALAGRAPANLGGGNTYQPSQGYKELETTFGPLSDEERAAAEVAIKKKRDTKPEEPPPAPTPPPVRRMTPRLPR